MLKLFIENFFEKYALYLLLVGLGLLFRYVLLRRTILDSALRRKKMAIEIIVVILITILWNNSLTSGSENTDDSLISIFLLLGYCFYVFIKKLPEDGYTESMLFIVNGFMLIALSFMSFPENIIFTIIIVLISFLFTKYWIDEKKSDFWEIVVLCVESFSYHYTCTKKKFLALLKSH